VDKSSGFKKKIRFVGQKMKLKGWCQTCSYRKIHQQERRGWVIGWISMQTP